MRTYVLFSPKGGTGRTMATMLLAMDALMQGRRVLLVDASDDAAYARKGEPAPLEEWAARVRESQPMPPLAAVTARDTDELHSVLWAARASRAAQRQQAARRSARAVPFFAALGPSAPDLVLVDSAARPDDRARLALRKADLVVVPFQSCMEARLIQAPLHHELNFAWPPYLRYPPVLAVGCALGADRTLMALNGAVQGCQGDEAWQDRWEAAREGATMRVDALAAMREGRLVQSGRARLLEAELPCASDLLRRLWDGELPLASSRRGGAKDGGASVKSGQTPADHPALLVDLAAVRLVAAEVELAALGPSGGRSAATAA